MALALLGFFVAGYLTLVQEGVFASAWDPFFGNGSDRVLHSSFSKSLPFSDAGLGAFTYLVEIGLGSIGGSYRWRRVPWAALAFEAVLVGAAVAGLGLVLVQATVVHRFCTLCLTSTGISVLILALSRLREARAAVRAVLARHAEGVSWMDALLGEPVDRLPLLAKQERLAEARALMAAVCTVAAGLALAVVAIFSYGLSGASLDAVWRDSFLGALLLGFGLAGCAAPVTAVRSAALQVLAGIGLLVTSRVCVVQ